MTPRTRLLCLKWGVALVFAGLGVLVLVKELVS